MGESGGGAVSHYPSPGPVLLYPSERRRERERVGKVRDWLAAHGFGWLPDGTYGLLPADVPAELGVGP